MQNVQFKMQDPKRAWLAFVIEHSRVVLSGKWLPLPAR